MRLRRHQLDGDPEQCEPADQLEIGQLQQGRHDPGKQDQQYGSTAGAQHHAPEPFLRRQRANR